MLEESGIKYISAMDRNQIETLAGLDFSAFSYFDPGNIENQADEMEDFRKLSENTYYREIKVEGKRRYILCFNPQLFKDQHKSRKTVRRKFQVFRIRLEQRTSFREKIATTQGHVQQVQKRNREIQA